MTNQVKNCCVYLFKISFLSVQPMMPLWFDSLLMLCCYFRNFSWWCKISFTQRRELRTGLMWRAARLVATRRWVLIGSFLFLSNKTWNHLHSEDPLFLCLDCHSLSVAGAATSLIFVATKVLSWQTLLWQTHVCRDKTHLWCDKSMLALTKLLSWQNYVCRDKRCGLCLSWQK